jgi:uncharacterized protein (TIGR02117 family)
MVLVLNVFVVGVVRDQDDTGRNVKRFVKWIGYVLAVLLLSVAGYFAAAQLINLMPVNSNWSPSEGGVDAYIASNGVHTDFVLPVTSASIDWRERIPLRHFSAPGVDINYIVLGWGDRDFYINTPRWEDLKAGTALRAGLGINPSVVHVTYIRELGQLRDVRPLPLSVAEYERLRDYLLDSFKYQDGAVMPLAGFSYGARDAFFEARGSYNLFRTCNEWTGAGLRAAGVRTGLWTPFHWNVIRHFETRR